MNSLMLFPLGIMFVLTIITSMYTSETYLGTSGDFNSDDDIIINEDGVNKTGSIDIPETESQTFDIWDSTGAMLILTAAIAAAILAGITVLGSGLSDRAQGIIFDGILYLGLWACLTIVARELIFAITFSMIIWVIITTMFIIGLGSHMGRADG